jgi:hypothetical protein
VGEYDGRIGTGRSVEEEKDVGWIQGEVEGQAEAGFGAPRALGPSIVSVVGQLARDEGKND